ncbi:ABC transporter substrate-binding protein [Streptomyces albipurpureus]|uniref:ABC transporter substrate-binding protein n=1 Tax=Streptomyces albipurpureus TaxID=2897419 RepID=A0ABT0UGQ2_9ACTN|nr:ABC transporter substrate-binding protein [Streptomyces sp. CWNU-1]MCM2387351.1 ABC transporter substrate-binding protein [Streptomyces sp. CWNU-1]
MQPPSLPRHTLARGLRRGRRTRVPGLMATALALTLALTACGGDPSEASDSEGSTGTGAFPVSVVHAKGKTVVKTKPKRVVALGYADVSVARALDAPIVGALKFAGGENTWNFPGVTPPLDKETAVFEAVTLNLEKIAALRPDLILMTSAQLPYQDAYDKLSAIAPTVGYRTKLLQDDPVELTRLIGSALGKSTEAEALIAASEKAIADFAVKHPYLKGKKALFGQGLGDGAHIIVAPDANVNHFFGKLGLSLPSEFTTLKRSGPTGGASLSLEELDRLDAADIAFLLFVDPKVKEHALVKRLELTRTGRLTGVDVGAAYALHETNPANTAYLLGVIEPTVAKLAP